MGLPAAFSRPAGAAPDERRAGPRREGRPPSPEAEIAVQVITTEPMILQQPLLRLLLLMNMIMMMIVNDNEAEPPCKVPRPA